jgi:hypothetical protein
MYYVRIEHKVQDYNNWKKLFDNDPIEREKSGVRQYTISRAADDPDYVLIDLLFETKQEAEKVVESLRAVWKDITGKILLDPRIRIVELIENKEYKS